MKTRSKIRGAARNFGILTNVFPRYFSYRFSPFTAIQREGVARGVAMQTYGTDAPVCYAPRHTRRDFNTNSGGCTARNTITTVGSFRFLCTSERKRTGNGRKISRDPRKSLFLLQVYPSDSPVGTSDMIFAFGRSTLEAAAIVKSRLPTAVNFLYPNTIAKKNKHTIIPGNLMSQERRDRRKISSHRKATRACGPGRGGPTMPLQFLPSAVSLYQCGEFRPSTRSIHFFVADCKYQRNLNVIFSPPITVSLRSLADFWREFTFANMRRLIVELTVVGSLARKTYIHANARCIYIYIYLSDCTVVPMGISRSNYD